MSSPAKYSLERSPKFSQTSRGPPTSGQTAWCAARSAGVPSVAARGGTRGGALRTHPRGAPGPGRSGRTRRRVRLTEPHPKAQRPPLRAREPGPPSPALPVGQSWALGKGPGGRAQESLWEIRGGKCAGATAPPPLPWAPCWHRALSVGAEQTPGNLFKPGPWPPAEQSVSSSTQTPPNPLRFPAPPLSVPSPRLLPLLRSGPSVPSSFSVSCQSPWHHPSLCLPIFRVSPSTRGPFLLGVAEPLVPPPSPQLRPRPRLRPISPGSRPQERSAAGLERPLACAHAPCSRLQSPPKGPSRLRAGRPERVRPPARSVSLVPPVTSDPVTVGWGWAGRS